ncbi:hypothetical protein HELRODRAFT_144444, partial [Helobdella robusta]|uniref:Zinc/iron permease n=1 Tax=Helobdella robusta TaxID=6412 RepID=T1EJE8_HELRO
SHVTRSIVLVLALSLHHLFEGLSIGLQMSVSNVWHLTIAVMCHEIAICFSMGLQFYKTDKKLTKKVFVILLVACIIGPGGIIIGLAISETGGTEHDIGQNTVNGVLQALACGTFIYVTFFEILFQELGSGKSSLFNIFAMIGGFIFMALLGLI